MGRRVCDNWREEDGDGLGRPRQATFFSGRADCVNVAVYGTCHSRHTRTLRVPSRGFDVSSFLRHTSPTPITHHRPHNDPRRALLTHSYLPVSISTATTTIAPIQYSTIPPLSHYSACRPTWAPPRLIPSSAPPARKSLSVSAANGANPPPFLPLQTVPVSARMLTTEQQ